MRRIRTINKAVNLMKELDPETAICYSMIKRAVDNGEIMSISSGTKKLVVFEEVYEHFTGEPYVETVISGKE